MKLPALFPRSVWLFALAGSAFAASPPAPRPTVEWLPRSFVKNPVLDVTVITEAAPAGRELAAPTADAPAYYFHHAAGYRETGHGYAGLSKPPVADVERAVRQSLAGAHFRPADAAHAPTLVLISHWGTYNRLDPDFPDVSNRELLTRLALIGGVRLADELRGVIQREEAFRGPGAGVALNSTSLLSEFHRFSERDALTRRIVDQARADSYGLVLSAYDYAALARGERRLLWRTKVSTDSSGLNFSETIPALAAAGREFFGRPMETPSTLTRNLRSRERIEYGELTEVGETAAAPAPANELIVRELAALEQGLFDYGTTANRKR